MIKGLPEPHLHLIGHRGAAGLAPENTLAGFKTAHRLGLNWVEFDIQVCATGEIILFHDSTLERTTSGQGLVSNTAFATIKQLDAGSWFDPAFKDEKIPTLSEALTLLDSLNIHPNIEIKTDPNISAPDLDAFLDILKQDWPKTKPLPLVSSFDLNVLIQLKEKKEDLPIGYLFEQNASQSVSQAFQDALKYDFDFLHCHYQAIKLNEIKKISQEIPVFIYTLNNDGMIRTFINQGASAIFSDLTQFNESSLKVSSTQAIVKNNDSM